MPRNAKTKTMTKQAKGWATRRARQALAKAAEPITSAPLLQTPQIKRSRARLSKAQLPAQVLSAVNPARDSDAEFAADILLAARQKGGAEKVAYMLAQRLSTVRSDTRDDAWKMHHRIFLADAERRRNRIIADFLQLAKGLPSQITTITSTTTNALVEALQEAGYTEHGHSRPCTDNAATDSTTVR